MAAEKGVKGFFENFCNKLQFCDPLDRKFERENADGELEEQATKVQEIVDKITKMPTFNGDQLQIILNEKKHKTLMDMFNKARFDLARVKAAFLIKVKEHALASDWKEKFKDLPDI